MSFPISINILSDDEEDEVNAGQTSPPPQKTRTGPVFVDITSPTPVQSNKKQRTGCFDPNPTPPTVFIIDDDPTPPPPPVSVSPVPSFVAETPFADHDFDEKWSKRDYSNTPVRLIAEDTPISEYSKNKVLDAKSFMDYPGIPESCFVPETPMSGPSKTEVPVVKHPEGIRKSCFVLETPVSEPSKTEVPVVKHPEGIGGLIYLESDNDSEEEGCVTARRDIDNSLAANDLERSSRLFESDSSFGNYNVSQTMRETLNSWSGEAGTSSAPSCLDSDTESLPKVIGLSEETDEYKDEANKNQNIDELRRKKTTSKEERDRLKEEKKKQKEQEKLQKAVEKAEAAEIRKLQKEKEKWEKGKLANKSIVAEIDHKVVEMGSVGGHLLTRFGEKDVSYRITSNPIERSILWTMTIPEHIAQISEETEVRYILLVFNAEEFCNLVANDTLMNHVSQVQCRYPYHTICYLSNRLMAYINKREQQQYKNPNCTNWTRPPIEEVLSNLTTHFARVHSRQCVDEAELAEHVVGLTCSLASCQFRKKLTRLSVNANGSSIPKDCVDRNLIKKNTWLKALVAIPKVQPRFAIAIWKKYPTMKSLLSVYMDPNKTVHEKEMLLKDLITEGLLGDDRRLGEVCSKRLYRILMAQCGNITADDAENGADLFNRQSA